MVRIYTDGACSNNPGPGGWGAVFTKKTGLKVLSGHEQETTNNRMELMAVVEALRFVYNKQDVFRGAEFEINSDSAYVINAINNSWLYKWKLNDWKTAKGTDVKNKDLWNEFILLRAKLEYGSGIVIKFIKVKGHSGDTYNEYVDNVAKQEVDKARQELQDNGGDNNG